VVGAGVMGQGIVQVCATAGYHVSLFDTDSHQTERAIAAIEQSLFSAAEKGKISKETAQSILERIDRTTRLEEIHAEIVIEAVVEQLQVKRDLLSRLEKVNSRSILATNTSTFPVGQVAELLIDPGRCVGLHFFNPAPVMKLVEVIAGPATAPSVLAAVHDFVKSLQKTPVMVKDSPGFIVNRVARPFYLESLKILEEGVAREAIDSLTRSSGFRMGPFELMDLIGIDTNLAVTESLYQAFGRPERFRPSKLQHEMVAKGLLGKKSGGGFYTIPEQKST